MSCYWWSTIISVLLSIIAFFIIKSCKWCCYSRNGERVRIPIWVLILWVGVLFIPVMGPISTLVAYGFIVLELVGYDGDWALIDMKDEEGKNNLMLKILAFLDKGI